MSRGPPISPKRASIRSTGVLRTGTRRPQVADWLVETERAVGSSIPLPSGQQGLGKELGLSRVTVNRALSALAATGAVRVRPRLVDVQDSTYLTTVSFSGRDTNTRAPNDRPS